MNTELPRLSRRDVLKFFAAAAAALGAEKLSAAMPLVPAPNGPIPVPNGYGTDPDLMKFYKPGDAWPLTFTKEQRAAATALADVILPADELGPAASALRVPDFVDEWVSAPYATQREGREAILAGLAWLDAEAQKRFQKDFAALDGGQQHAICDDICWHEDAKPEFRKAANFFNQFRSLCAAAYYATPEGWKAIGYVGNVPLQAYDGPPPEILKRLGLEQTVK